MWRAVSCRYRPKQDNWDKLYEYFKYIPAIRKLIYTTNTVEGYHRQIYKVTKIRACSNRYSPWKTGVSCIQQHIISHYLFQLFASATGTVFCICFWLSIIKILIPIFTIFPMVFLYRIHVIFINNCLHLLILMQNCILPF